MQDKAMLIDTSRCTACRGCMVACKQWNQLPGSTTTKNTGSYENPPTLNGSTYTKINFLEVVDNGKLKWLFRKEQCLHCTKAACIEMCPVDARSKNEFGLTEIDREKCIGCGICVSACPYKVAQLDDEKKTTSCWMCLDRVLNGMKPACAKTCPAGAIKFGTRDEMVAMGREMAAKSNGELHLYGVNEFKGLHVLYLLKADPSVYGLPVESEEKVTRLEMYAYLQENLDSPNRDEVLVKAALKYFGKVHV